VAAAGWAEACPSGGAASPKPPTTAVTARSIALRKTHLITSFLLSPTTRRGRASECDMPPHVIRSPHRSRAGSRGRTLFEAPRRGDRAERDAACDGGGKLTEHVDRHLQSTVATSSSPSRAGLPMTSISVIMPFEIVKRSALTNRPCGATTTPMAPSTSAGRVSRASCP
jgi:hypothetical protein